ncbi:COG4-domain-containing protein [Atractiella rhizophila]|nr:COG4-domain-containing protein [Atractiella rhizophila]
MATTSTMTAPLAFASLTSVTSITSALRHLSTQESALDSSLQSQISHRQHLNDQLELIESVVPVLARIERDGSRMDERINETADVAERIGGIIGQLDEEQSRVQQCISMVQSVQDLKNSLLALESSVGLADWESATRHYHRCITIPPSVISSKFAEAVVPTATLPLSPQQTLDNFATTLLDTFLKEFRLAARERDEAKISRFFKLFPMIGKESEGLGAYAEFVSEIVSGRMAGLMNTGGAKTSHPSYYSALLTSLFENIALIIAQHQPVIEKYYGKEGKVAVVLERVQSECCNHLGSVLLNRWEDDRRVVRKIEDLATYRYPFLTSLVFPSLIAPPNRPSTPLLNINASTASRFVNIQPPFRQSTLPVSTAPGNPGLGITGADENDNTSELREADGILGEISLMQGRWELYRRFIYTRALELGDEEDEKEDQIDSLKFLEDSVLKIAIEERIDRFYRPMELWFMRCSIEKAHQLDEFDLSCTPYLSSALDDSFYILKKVLNRTLATSSLRTVQSLLPPFQEVMIKDFSEVLRKRLENVYANIPANAPAEKEREGRVQFIVYLNDLDTGAEYMNRLGDDLLGSEAVKSGFWKSRERKMAVQLLEELKKNVEESLKQVVKAGVNQLFNQLVRPKLRTLMSDCYKDVSYELDEDGHSEAEFQDLVRKRFVKGWEQLINVFRETLTPSNYHLFFSMTVTVLVRPWETIIRGLKFTELGGLKFDRDLRTIMTYLSSQTTFGSGVMRDAFARLQHISALLTLESPEDADDVGGRLTQHEIKAVLAQRI